MSVAPETYPGTQVYRNKLHITDGKALAEAEASLTWARTELYRTMARSTTFDLAHLREIHGYLFQDLYDWAGELRSYDIRKGWCEFTPAAEIEHYASEVYTVLASENYLQDLRGEPYLRRLAYYYDLTNRLHPFPEGNGRTQRLFMEDLAAITGHAIDWAAVHSWEIVETAIQSFDGNREPLVWMFERIVTPAL